jgi:hypothetical protein
MDRKELWGIEFDWYASDRDGHVALLSTAGNALIPTVVLEAAAGIYLQGEETSALLPCGSDERWWVAGTATFQRAYDDSLSGSAGLRMVRVRLRGDRSDARGGFGHLNQYDRDFVLTKNIAMRRATTEDCASCRSGLKCR